MAKSINEIISSLQLKANYVSAGTSLADNPVVKRWELESLQKNIRTLASEKSDLPDVNESADHLCGFLDDLSELSGKEFRDGAQPLKGLVASFCDLVS